MRYTDSVRIALIFLAALVATLVILVFAFHEVLTQPVATGVMRGPKQSADVGRLEADVKTLAHPRDYTNTKQLDEDATGLGDRLRALGMTPIGRRFDAGGRTYQNVSAILGDPKRPRVVVGAHYDSDHALPAADDNASGVAVVLELARLFAATPPPGTVELVFWTLEEEPYFAESEMGSAVHANALAKEGVTVTAALSIETVGYYKNEPRTQHFPAPFVGSLYPSAGNFIALVSNTGADNRALVRRVKSAMRAVGTIDVHSMNGPAWIPGIDWSDHRSYWPHGWPALMITDTAPNRNPNYHEATDTPDTLDYGKMAALTEAIFEAIWVLATDH